MPTETLPHNSLPQKRLYGRRKGHGLSARQLGLLEHVLPRLELTLEAGREPREYFLPVGHGIAEVWLEIGFGAGEHLFWQARHHPAAGIIGAEPYVSGVAKLLSRIAAPSGSGMEPPPPHAREETSGGGGTLPNIRLYMQDARDIVDALPDRSLSRVFILFPDPWPKTRHHKRRFIQTEMLSRLARVMKSGAELRFATDDMGYLVWALERLCVHPAFAWLAQSAADWRRRPADWPETRYEAKALKGGRACAYLRFARRS